MVEWLEREVLRGVAQADPVVEPAPPFLGTFMESEAIDLLNPGIWRSLMSSWEV